MLIFEQIDGIEHFKTIGTNQLKATKVPTLPFDGLRLFTSGVYFVTRKLLR